MPPPPKRNPARRNKSTTRATLPRDHDVEMPPLPTRYIQKDGDQVEVDWNEMTISWWVDIWASPMAPEFEKSDVHGLYVLAALVDSFWTHPSKETAAEIRLQRQAFGLSPIDRRRLQWEIERTDEAQDKGKRRRASQEKAPKNEGADAYGALRAV